MGFAYSQYAHNYKLILSMSTCNAKFARFLRKRALGGMTLPASIVTLKRSVSQFLSVDLCCYPHLAVNLADQTFLDDLASSLLEYRPHVLSFPLFLTGLLYTRALAACVRIGMLHNLYTTMHIARFLSLVRVEDISLA